MRDYRVLLSFWISLAHDENFLIPVKKFIRMPIAPYAGLCVDVGVATVEVSSMITYDPDGKCIHAELENYIEDNEECAIDTLDKLINVHGWSFYKGATCSKSALLDEFFREQYRKEYRKLEARVAELRVLAGDAVNGIIIKKCQNCGVDYEVSCGPGGPKRYCTEACRSAAYRARQARACGMYAEGKSFGDIANELGSDVDTVTKWVTDER